MTEPIFCVIMLILLFRDFIDNSALRACASELKRIADAMERGVKIMDRWEL